ncbi:MAG: hypothetical protein NC396_00775 [Bacteroides sp.]|nr:hypothetical protein [Bacteroides sp.]MCM1084855.1 hypothetical protein [Bacteroides sp.]
MRNKIAIHYPSPNISVVKGGHLYIADFSERTKGKRGVEIHESMPSCPKDLRVPMDCFEVVNLQKLEVGFNVFEDHQFKNKKGEDIEHCEGCLFPIVKGDVSWVVMLEIKDCKSKNIKNYREKAVNQIVSVTEIFREKQIITKQKVYGVIALPKHKTAFDYTMFGMPPMYKELKQKHNILFSATNRILIDKTSVKPKLKDEINDAPIF